MKKNNNNEKKTLRIMKKFSLSSIVSFIIDYGLFMLFSLIISSVVICNILARVFSACCNYYFNRKYVFNSKVGLYKSFSSYCLLAIMILTFNTLFLHIFVDIFLVNRYIAKIIVEILLFLFSFFVQKKYVFKKQ